MQFREHWPQENLFRYTFLRWHVTAFLRPEPVDMDWYLHGLSFSVFPRGQLAPADFFETPRPRGDRATAEGPRFQPLGMLRPDNSIGTATMDSISAEVLASRIASEDRPTAIIGSPGAGKTALLFFLFAECLTADSELHKLEFVPCYVRCQTEGATKGRRSLEQLVADTWKVGLDATDVRKALEQLPRCLFLFDLTRQDGLGRNVLNEAADFALKQSSEPSGGTPGHRVVVTLRSSWSSMVDDAPKRFRVWSLEGISTPDAALDYIKAASLPAELTEALMQLLDQNPELSQLPIWWDLLVDLAGRFPEAVCNAGGYPEPQWMLALGALDRDRSTRFQDHQLANLGVWGDRNPVLLRKAHPIDMLLQELANRMQFLEVGAITLEELDQFGADVAERVRHGEIKWWLPDWLDLLSDEPSTGIQWLMGDLPLFVRQERRLRWTEGRFFEAFCLRHEYYDRRYGLCRQVTTHPEDPTIVSETGRRVARVKGQLEESSEQKVIDALISHWPQDELESLVEALEQQTDDVRLWNLGTRLRWRLQDSRSHDAQ